MRCKCKLFDTNSPASDGSIVSRDVIEQYLASEDYKKIIASHSTLGALSHRARDLKNLPPEAGSNLKNTVGKDDSLIIIAEGAPAPTHYIERIYLETDGWCYADIKILEEEGLDDIAIQNIRRLKGLLKQGIFLGCSMVLVAWWDGEKGGPDYARKIHSIKALDITLNPSWKNAGIVEVYQDEEKDKNFSNIEKIDPKEFKFKGIKAKAFSDLNALGCGDLIKSSKINGHFTKLKAKQFSACGVVEELPEQKEMSEVEVKQEETQQKEFSVATVKERIRFAKYSPRQRFRRLIMDYKAVVRQAGGQEKIDPETLKVMKSLFTTDVLDIMKTITPDILKGKQIATLIGASSLGKNVRLAAQKLQIPFRMAFQEESKQKYISKNRYQKIQDAYIEFTKSLIEEVFGVAPIVNENGEEEVEEPNLGVVNK